MKRGNTQIVTYMLFTYIPAQLKKGKSWYISWTITDPQTLKRKRFRHTFGMNRIADKRERLRYAKLQLNDINSKLAAGLQDVLDDLHEDGISLTAAMNMALKKKSMLVSKKTMVQYTYIHRIFLEWAKKKGLDEINCRQFNKKTARAFVDHQIFTRTLVGKTINNYVTALRALFTEIVKSEFIDENPFSCLGKMRESRKIRRALSDKEKFILAKHIKETDPYMFLGVILLYYCLIRPGELREMRIRDLRIDEGTIFLPGSITKNRNDSVVTIPNVALQLLEPYKLHDYGRSWYIFGPGLRPHPSLQCGANTMNERHRKHLVRVQKQGHIPDIKGLSFYSWKDTMDQDMAAANVDIISIRDHNRHASIETTNRYMLTRPRRIKAIAELPWNILSGEMHGPPSDDW